MSYKNNIKIYNNIAPTCFGAVTPSSGSALFVLAKVTLPNSATYIHQQGPTNICSHITTDLITHRCRGQLKCDGTRTETRFCLLLKRTSPFKSAGPSVQSTTGSRVVRISDSNVGYTTFRGSVRVLATHSIHQFPLHFPSHASPCTITFQLDSIIIDYFNNV